MAKKINQKPNKSAVFCDPLDDQAFKIVMGEKYGKKNMINFLRALLPELGVMDIQYLDSEQVGLSVKEGKSIYDLVVTTEDGTRVIVEMQNANLRYFNYRSVYYATHAIQMQANLERAQQHELCKKKGIKPHWNYKYSAVYFIGILSQGMGGESNNAHYLRHYRIMETSTGEDLNVDVNFLFLSLNRFKKSASEAKGSPIDMFLYSIKHIGGTDKIPDCFEDSPEMTGFFNTAMWANMPPEARHEFEINKNMTTENDILVAIDEAEERGEARGVAKGEARGVAIGVAKGKAEIARNFKNQGVDIEIIANCTGLSVAEIEKL